MKKLKSLLDGKLSLDMKELLKGSGAAFIVNAAGFVLLYTLTLIITNNLGAKIYGDYALFVYTVRIVTIFAVFGIDIMALRYISEYFSKAEWGKINELTIQSYASLFIVSLFIASICYFFSENIAATLKVSHLFVVLIGIAVIPYCFNKFHNQCFRGQKKILIFSSFEFALIPLMSIIMLGTLLLLGKEPVERANLPIAVHLVSLSIVSLASFALWTYQRTQTKIEKLGTSVFDIASRFFPTLQKGFPFLLARTSTYLAAWSMLFLLKYYRTSEDVGIYEAALKVAQLTILPLSAINAIAAPKFSEFFGKNNIKGLEKTARHSTLLSVSIAIPFVITILFFSKQIMGFYGDEFLKGVLVLQILAIGQLLNAMTGPVAQVLQMTDNQKTHQNITLISVAISLFLGMFLVSKYGLVGTAFTYLVFVVVNNGTCFLWINLKLKISTFPRF